jgi:DNA-binding transcriptional MerR regulator
MAQVTHLTGIQAHTLRVWERRYDFVKAKRKESKFRYYTEEQLRILLNTSILLQNGFRISAIAKLEESEINQEVELIFNQSAEIKSDQIQALVLAMLHFDEPLFNKIYTKTVKSQGLLNTFTKVIYPFLNLIGGLWMYNKANPAQEHFISNLIRQKLIAATDMLEAPKPDAPEIAMFLLEGDYHELGLLLGYFLAKQAGWKVLYLGVRVPVTDLISILQHTKARVLFSTFTISNPSQQDNLLEVIGAQSETTLLISGNKNAFESFTEHSQIKYLAGPSELIAFLESHESLISMA